MSKKDEKTAAVGATVDRVREDKPEGTCSHDGCSYKATEWADRQHVCLYHAAMIEPNAFKDRFEAAKERSNAEYRAAVDDWIEKLSRGSAPRQG